MGPQLYQRMSNMATTICILLHKFQNGCTFCSSSTSYSYFSAALVEIYHILHLHNEADHCTHKLTWTKSFRSQNIDRKSHLVPYCTIPKCWISICIGILVWHSLKWSDKISTPHPLILKNSCYKTCVNILEVYSAKYNIISETPTLQVVAFP